jgi:hypothetical protein
MRIMRPSECMNRNTGVSQICNLQQYAHLPFPNFWSNLETPQWQE